MRTDSDLLELIMKKAVDDERIRAVTLNGSRASQTAMKDQYCDFDIVYFVEDVREFTRDKNWVSIYGDILIVQYSMDWFSKPYDYTSRDTFIFLMQFADGHRIDLSIVDISNIENEKEDREPRIVLLNKDNFKELETSMDESVYNITRPSEMEFYNTCNEFRWLSIYVSKGLCRRELYYAKYAYDVLIMEMFMKMLNWKIGLENDFSISTGGHSKYLKRYLSDREMDRVHSIFPSGAYEDIWEKLFDMYDFFHELEKKVSEHFGFCSNHDERIKVREFLAMRKYEFFVTEKTKRVILLEDFNPDWKAGFDLEAANLSSILVDCMLEIHHMGSTAIQFIKAKPTIDILIVVNDIDEVAKHEAALQSIGYLAKGENGMVGRRYFSKGGSNHTHHVHIFQAGNPEIARHLNFRDYMNAHASDAQEYSRLKEDLAEEFKDSGVKYTDGKNEFIRQIDHKAAIWRESEF